MIVCSSNAWGGSLPTYLEYIIELAHTADVLCLQEVHRAENAHVPARLMPNDPGSRTMSLNLHLYNQLQVALQDTFHCFFACQMQGYLHDMEATEYDVSYGNAMFIRKSLEVEVVSEQMVYKVGPQHNCGDTAAWKSAQACVLVHQNNPRLISHTHGAWWNSNKGDVPYRHEQFANWYRFLEGVAAQYNTTHTVLCGDFNQTSDTKLIQSIPTWSVFGSEPGHNLLELAGIKDTRTKLYKKPIREADYMITSPGLTTELTVDYNAPSDHATLIGEFV